MGASVTARIAAEGFRTELISGTHELIADEPESMGGGNEGPGPYEYLAAALGSCTAMTLRMYADRKGWALEGVEVTVSHGKIHAEDCKGCETKEGRVDRFERTIAMRGDLDAEQRERLLEIADKCPVHKTLENEIAIVTAEGESGSN